MGRRRRKGNPRRRSLLFEESPVADSRQLAGSPVACADNPVTAVSVPIDSDCSVTWVSPQFGGITLSAGRRRKARKQRNISNAPGDGSTKENSRTRSSRNGTRNKFPALQFVGDSVRSSKTSAPTARAEKVTVLLEDGQVSQRVGEGGKSKDRAGSEIKDRTNNSVGNECGADVSLSNGEEDYGCAETVRKRASFRESAGLRHRPSLARCSVYRGRRSDFPDQANGSKDSSQVDTAAWSESKACSDEDNNLWTSSDRKIEDRRKGYNSDILLSPAEVSNLLESRRSTPLGVGEIHLRVALFAPSPSEDALSFSTGGAGCSPQQHSQSLVNDQANSAALHSQSLVNDQANSATLHSQSLINDQANSATRGTRRTRGSTAEEGRRSHSKEPAASQKERPRRSERQKHKLREAMKFLQPRTPQNRGSVNVLVSDTPECEYSLTFRQRQCLGKKKNKL